LAVSIVYLIPQMVGAGALIKPLLGLSHVYGVLIVGVVVTVIVVTAGMVSTTYVQFIKGSLLVIFCFILTMMILNRGLSTQPEFGGQKSHHFEEIPENELWVARVTWKSNLPPEAEQAKLTLKLKEVAG